MAKVSQIIKASLQKILVQASEADIEASEAQDFIFAMNNYMLDLDAKGISLGYTAVSDLGDNVTIPTGALRGLIYNMAIEMAPEFNATATQEVIAIASAGLKTMQLLGQTMPQSQYPNTLPVGSGNEHNVGLLTSHYYPDLEDEILAETTGSIVLESGTEAAS
jgi:hypothetical protein